MRTIITMDDLRNTDAMTCLDEILTVIEKTKACMRTYEYNNDNRNREYERLKCRLERNLEFLTDELLANNYTPEVWAYVGEKLNKL